MPASTSAAWKTAAPTGVTGAISPSSVTGTNSIGMPACAQSSRFWQESSPYRKDPVGVTVNTANGRAARSAASARNSRSIAAIRGTPCSVNAPVTTAERDSDTTRNSRHASATATGTSAVENAVARWSTPGSPDASRTYARKSAVSASRVTPVR